MVLAAGATGPDLMIHVGDMAYGSGTDEEFTQNFYAIYQEQLRSIPVWPAIGNHEGKTSFSADQSGPYFEGYVLPSAAEAPSVPTRSRFLEGHGVLPAGRLAAAVHSPEDLVNLMIKLHTNIRRSPLPRRRRREQTRALVHPRPLHQRGTARVQVRERVRRCP